MSLVLYIVLIYYYTLSTLHRNTFASLDVDLIRGRNIVFICILKYSVYKSCCKTLRKGVNMNKRNYLKQRSSNMENKRENHRSKNRKRKSEEKSCEWGVGD